MTIDELSLATDDLNELLLRAEERLTMYSCGVAASVKLDDESEMVFSKEGADWGLRINGTRIVHTSRRLRITAAHALDDLRGVLRAGKSRELHNVMEARRAVRAFLGLDRGPVDT